MNKLLAFAVLLVLASPALGCDETCQRDRASVTYNVEFPGYLSWKFCEDTRMAFVESDVSSLERYRKDRLDTKYKGSMRNIKDFIEQRKSWLAECDDYMNKTNRGRIFKDDATTQQLFTSMDAVSSELDKVIKGVTYVASGDQDEQTIIGSKFDQLFKLVDDHKAVMMLKGQFVTN
jgi:predicted transcriptional regulator